MVKYKLKNGNVLKDGHTMFMQDVVKDLNRKAFLEDDRLKNLGEGTPEPPKLCCAKLPNDDEIEQVAFDESGQQDWDKLEDERTYRGGFVDGAEWFRSQVK